MALSLTSQLSPPTPAGQLGRAGSLSGLSQQNLGGSGPPSSSVELLPDQLCAQAPCTLHKGAAVAAACAADQIQAPEFSGQPAWAMSTSVPLAGFNSSYARFCHESGMSPARVAGNAQRSLRSGVVLAAGSTPNLAVEINGQAVTGLGQLFEAVTKRGGQQVSVKPHVHKLYKALYTQLFASLLD